MGTKKSSGFDTYSKMPPGFRSGKPLFMVLSAIGYIALTWFCFTLKLEQGGVQLSGAELYLQRIVLWISQIAFIFFVGDYRGFRTRRFSFLYNKNFFLRLSLYVIVDIVIILIASIFCLIVQSIIF